MRPTLLRPSPTPSPLSPYPMTGASGSAPLSGCSPAPSNFHTTPGTDANSRWGAALRTPHLFAVRLHQRWKPQWQVFREATGSEVPGIRPLSFQDICFLVMAGLDRELSDLPARHRSPCRI